MSRIVDALKRVGKYKGTKMGEGDMYSKLESAGFGDEQINAILDMFQQYKKTGWRKRVALGLGGAALLGSLYGNYKLSNDKGFLQEDNSSLTKTLSEERGNYAKLNEDYAKLLAGQQVAKQEQQPEAQTQAPLPPLPTPQTPTPEAPTAPSEVKFVNKVYNISKGDILTKIVMEHYYGGKEVSNILKEVAEYNKIPLNSKLKAGQNLFIPYSAGEEGTKYWEITVKYDGETLDSFVRRDIANTTNIVARENEITLDNRAVVPLGYAEEKKLDIVSFVNPRKGNYTDNDLVVVVMADGVADGKLKIGQEITLPYYKVKVEAPAEEEKGGKAPQPENPQTGQLNPSNMTAMYQLDNPNLFNNAPRGMYDKAAQKVGSNGLESRMHPAFDKASLELAKFYGV